jgi:hypothetical protein
MRLAGTTTYERSLRDIAAHRKIERSLRIRSNDVESREHVKLALKPAELAASNEFMPVVWVKYFARVVGHSDVDDRLTVDWPTEDLSALPGQAVTKKVLERDRTAQRLLALIERFRTTGFSWSLEPCQITVDTARTAIRLIQALPKDRGLPKIVPDGEGALLLMWETPQREVLVIVDDNALHLVRHPASAQTEYVENLRLDGAEIPESILGSVPKY